MCKKTQHLAIHAARHWEEVPCFWLRGIPPPDWSSSIPEPPDEMEPRLLDLKDPLSDEGGKSDVTFVFGDGSGGSRSADPRLRRTAWAWIAVSGEEVLKVFWKFF